NRNRPSRDQSTGHCAFAECVMRSSLPTPLASLRYRFQGLPERNTIDRPFGDQIGKTFIPGVNVKRLETFLSASISQRSAPELLGREATTRRPSGERAKPM